VCILKQKLLTTPLGHMCILEFPFLLFISTSKLKFRYCCYKMTHWSDDSSYEMNFEILPIFIIRSLFYTLLWFL
jgi:hypothetical protein